MKKKKKELYQEINEPQTPTELPRLSDSPFDELQPAKNLSKHPSHLNLNPKDIKHVQQEGKIEALKENAKIQEENLQKIESVSNQKARILFSCKAVFPFDFFPDELVIEDTKVNFINKQFFLSATIQSMSIKDIYEATVSTSVFFATLQVTSRFMLEGEMKIQFLKKQDAIYARRLIEGLRTLEQQRIDTTLLEATSLINRIEEIGKVRTIE